MSAPVTRKRGVLPEPDVVGESERGRLDDLIHSPVRFTIAAALAATEEAEFGAVRDAVQITDSSLSKHAAALELAG